MTVSGAQALLRAVAAGRDGDNQPAPTDAPALDDWLQAAWDCARAEFPDVDISLQDYGSYLGARVQADGDSSLVPALEELRATDLYLACACSVANPSALATFDLRFNSEIRGALSRMRLPDSQALEEILQLIRHRLFTAPAGKTPKIAEYAGRSQLRRWVRSVAVRTCLNYLRKGKREVLTANERVLYGVTSAGDDPELAYMKAKYQREFREAFQRGLALLTARELSLLQYHYVDELNIDEIGNIYRVHRVTAFRWLEKARAALIQKVNDEMRTSLAIDDREYESIMRLIQSQLHISLKRYLADEKEPQ